MRRCQKVVVWKAKMFFQARAFCFTPRDTLSPCPTGTAMSKRLKQTPSSNAYSMCDMHEDILERIASFLPPPTPSRSSPRPRACSEAPPSKVPYRSA